MVERNRKMKKIIIILVLLTAAWRLTPPNSVRASEYTMKGVFLERISRFVEWPESSSIKNNSKPFVIVIIGKNPFGSTLEQLYSNRKIKKKKVEIKYIEGTGDIPECHVLFISKSMKNEVDRIISATRNKPILTLGDTKGFAEKNKVLVNLYAVSKHYPFVINATAFRESGLKIDYHLLDMAKIVK